MEPTPEHLVKLRRERIERAMQMTPEQRVVAGIELFAMSIEAIRAGARMQHPGASDEQIDEIVRQRVEKKRKRDEVRF